MKCPECKKEITFVIILCACQGSGVLKGNRMIERGWEDPYFDEITDVQCPECKKDIGYAIEGY